MGCHRCPDVGGLERISLNYVVPAVIHVLVAAALLAFVLVWTWRNRGERVAAWLIATIVLKGPYIPIRPLSSAERAS